MAKLKGVILGIEDVLAPIGSVNMDIFSEVDKLIKFFRKRGVEFAVLTNRDWTTDNNKRDLKDALIERWGNFPYFCRAKDNAIPAKQTSQSTIYVREKLGWNKNETVYIGASDTDMQAAVNGGLLFLRASWWATKSEYGFSFDSPKNIANFIDTFCLRDHLWCHQVDDGNVRFYALAPFSTYKQEYTLYSEDAKAAAKHGQGHPDFWVGALISSLYFSGVCHEMDYICTYPGHQAGPHKNIMSDAMDILGKCFRTNYIPNLLLRHTTAIKSQTARSKGQEVNHLNQLNTIQLNKTPRRTATKNYKSSPIKKNKTVLLVDDICTRGYSLESARAYLEQTGCNVIMVSWLKTINTDIELLGTLGKFNPYQPNTFQTPTIQKKISYNANIIDHLAPAELTKKFNEFQNWSWPED